MTIDVQARDVTNVVAQSADGYYVYPHAHASGGTLLHRTLIEGAEDFVSFETRPAVPEVDYQVSLGDEVSGLRLVGNTLEMVDQDGTPRLRAEPPYVVGADGARTDATLAVEGCAVDTDASAPWGRDTVDPGARSCTVKVRWPDESVVYPAVLDPRWTTTGSMTTARQGHTATLLSTGNVLVVGGTSNGSTALASAELYNRTTGTWAATGSMTGARTLHTATQLNTGSNGTTSGKVLVAGGLNGTTSQNTAQLYSPSAGTWTAAANLNAARHFHSATLLADGRVLVAGGLNGTTILQTAALYNPASGTGTWTATTGPIPPPGLKNHAAVLLTTSNNQLANKVLLVGGNNGTSTVSSVFLFDPTQSAFSSLTALSSPREGHTATVLKNGNVLITGGKNGSSVLATTMLFNPSSSNGTWSSAGTMTTARQLHAAVLLPSGIVENGQVLVAGGNNGTSTLGTAELWNGTSTWTATSALPAPVQGETATVLPNNMVLIAGGVNGSTTVATADLYDASFALACTSNGQCATGFCVNGVCCDTACNGGCGVCNLPGKVGTCSAASSTTVCRAQNGVCDVAETCSGTSLSCPSDAVAALGTVCRPQNGICDVAETCNGTTKACPADGFAPPTTVCHASIGTCDTTVACTGNSPSCPPDMPAPAGTVCRPAAGGCDVAETCTGNSSLCPADSVAPAGAVCRPAVSICDVAETCDGSSSACPADTFGAAGTACGAATDNEPAPVCSGSSGTCPVGSGTSDILGFEELTDWLIDPSDSAGTTIVGLNSNRTEGQSSLEVTAQNAARFDSAPMSSIGSVGPLVLLDILLPTSQANPSSFGDVQMFLNCPTLGLFNLSLGDVPLTGLALGTFQTLAFQMPASTQTTLANGIYADLTFSVVLNVDPTETGHYLLDNIRSVSDVVPSVLGIAQDGLTLKAVFDYQTTSSTPVNIPYGTANGLTNQNGFVASPPEAPPSTFVSATHAPFVATLSGSLLTWTIGSHSATATPGSRQLPVTQLPDGTHDATLPDGRKVNIDSTPPQNPTPGSDPGVGDTFNGALNGTFSVSPNGASTYTVPIQIPPGVAAMEPNLSLVYNSQTGDGIAGQGWQLSGLSIVHRCPRTRQEDGTAAPVTMLSQPVIASKDLSTSGDGICLDGERLFEQGSGTYLSEKTDFSKITYFADDHFEVLTKANETRYYGLTSKSKVIAQGVISDGISQMTQTTGTAMWALERVRDPWGNYFDVHYNEDNADFAVTGIRVSSIAYTGHMDASGNIDTQPFNTITFGYDPPPSAGASSTRPDVRWTRFGTTQIPKNRRLSTITTPRGTYTLTYLNNTAFASPSLLSEIAYCAGSTCPKPLFFTWPPNNQGWPAASGYTLPSDLGTTHGLSGTQLVDLNGDGRLDLVVGRTNGTNSTNTCQATLSNPHPSDCVPQTGAYLNTGTGWGPALTGPNQTLPVYLADANDQVTTAQFADMDGDGLLDIIVDNANVVNTSSGYLSCPVGVGPGNPGCINPTNYQPAVWINRFNLDGSGGWEFHPEYSGLPNVDPENFPSPLNFKPVGHTIAVTDIDGDGKMDIVGLTTILSETTVDVFLNQGLVNGPRWVGSMENVFGGPSPQLQDVNRDGLPDFVTDTFYTQPDGTLSAIETTAINQGLDPTSNTPIFAPPTTHGFPPTPTPTDLLRVPQHADIDGDGLFDTVDYYHKPDPADRDAITSAFTATVALGDGISLGIEDPFAANYLSALKAVSPRDIAGEFIFPEDFGYALVDINGDGLADLVRNHRNRSAGISAVPDQGGGEVLYNTGQTWSSGSSMFNTWQISTGPNRIPGVVPSDVTGGCGSAFVDLNGDGTVDLIQEEGSSAFCAGDAEMRASWFNSSPPPVITSFPNGLSVSTGVTYVSTAEADAHTAGVPCDGIQPHAVYCDDDPIDPGTKRMASPIRVVSKVSMADGTGALSDIGYAYHSLRTDPNGRGPLGFHRMIAYDHASGVVTETTYSQAYPYTGMPKEVDRYQLLSSGQVQLTGTATQYCDSVGLDSSGNPACSQPGASYPPKTPVFVYADEVVDTTYTHPETGDTSDYIKITSDFRYDDQGNSTKTVVNTQLVETGSATQSVTKETDNQYGTAGSPEDLQGKPTFTTEISTSTQVGPFDGSVRQHHTGYTYSPVSTFGGASATALVMTKKQLEPSAGYPIELDTVLAYDHFGNTVTTTSCANDFDGCQPGAPGPVGTSDPQHHPPYRTTTTSYSTSDFNKPLGGGLIQSLSYGDGRFPVKVVNAGGHTEYSAYDPIKGLLLQKTGPNGISLCHIYDDLGRETSLINRCGSAEPLVTTTSYFEIPVVNFQQPPGTPPGADNVTEIRSPDGQTTWTYVDGEGKSVGTLKHSFDGGFIGTLTSYNALRKVTQTSKPFLLAALTDQPSPAFTKTVYDAFNRVQQVTDDLGVIDNSNAPKTTIITTTYDGPKTETDRTVNGQTQTRVEVHGATGTIASVIDDGDMELDYVYDSDGNIRKTVTSGATIDTFYDTRNRKLEAIDPDLGDWSYTYDGFGDLVHQLDAKEQQLTMLYDPLGRMIAKTDVSTGNTAQWIYDTAPGAGIGKLAATVSESDPSLLGPCAMPPGVASDGTNRSVKSYAFDSFGNLQTASECIDGTTFQTSYGYDVLGRQNLIRYPLVNHSQLAVGYHYTSLGFLQYLTDESSDYSVLWQAKVMNALGQVTDEQARNGVETVATRNPATGWLMTSTSTAHSDGNTVIQNWSYGFDEVGNLLTRDRTDQVNDAPSTETFSYDIHNRVTVSQVNVGPTTGMGNYAYDGANNLQQKNGQSYTYGGCTAGTRFAGPHAVCSVGGGTAYVYDTNGNITNSGSRTVTYNVHNMVVGIDSHPTPSQGNDTGTAKFSYGADENRVVQSVTSGGATSRTVYVGLAGTGKSMYERTTTGSTVEHVNFIYAGSVHGGNAFAVRLMDDSGAVTADRYFNFDHLGSTTAVSDEKGHLSTSGGSETAVLGYDPWGARREPDGNAAPPASFSPVVGHREFTGQETIPDVGLINMNGRVYDPVLARFLSADPNVTDVNDPQSYNRYSYASNNPLRYTDPTGFSFWGDVLGYFENPANDFFLLTSAIICASTVAGCVAWGIMQTVMNVADSVSSGQSFGQTALSLGIGAGFSFLTMGTVSALGGGGLASIIGGSISAAASTALTDVARGRNPGWDVLEAAFVSAAAGAFSYGVQQAAAVTRASAMQGNDPEDDVANSDPHRASAASGASGRADDPGPAICGTKGGPRCGDLSELTGSQKATLKNFGDQFHGDQDLSSQLTESMGGRREMTFEMYTSSDHVRLDYIVHDEGEFEVGWPRNNSGPGEIDVVSAHSHFDVPMTNQDNYPSKFDLRESQPTLNVVITPSGSYLYNRTTVWNVTGIVGLP